MKKTYILLLLLSTVLFSKVIVGENIEQFHVNDQFDKMQTIKQETEKIIFVFSKEKGHIVRNFLEKKSADYLSSKNILFVADVSKMPSLIRWFVLDDLDRYNFSIILIEDDLIAKKYIDETRQDKIMVVSLHNLKVSGVDFFDQIEELENLIENN
ncbi:MAG: hypothetical protein WBG69_02030 [Arcobacteraceae bacterium]